jgi:RNA recognition motif-containing protein
MASELLQKLNARRDKIEAESDKLESEPAPSMSDCPRVSPRKVKAEEQTTIPRVASPQQRTRRPSQNFKDTMVKRRSLTDSKAEHYEGTPGKEQSTPKKVEESVTPSKGFVPQDKTNETSACEFQDAMAKRRSLTDSHEKSDESVATDDIDKLGDEHSPEMSIPEDPACKVYVGNLAWKTKFQSLKAHMAKSGGEIAFAGILTDDGNVDGYGWSRGFGFVIYETPEEAKAAVEKMNGTDLDNRKITVDLWAEDGSAEESKPKRQEKARSWKSRSEEGWNSRHEDDWYWNMFGRMAGQRWAQPRSRQNRSWRGDTKVRAWVGNLNYRSDWKDLKDHMEPAGDVKWSEILTRGGYQGGKSKGMGFVDYKTPEQVTEAVNSLNGTEMQGRQIVVDHWTTRSSSKSRQ